MRLALVILLATGCAGAAPRASAETSRLEELAWLAGRWETADDRTLDGRTAGEDIAGEPIIGEPIVGEHWTVVSGRLLGEGYSGRAPHADTVTERLEISEGPDGLLYIAAPLDQERTEFAITEFDEHHFVATNPAHDFPTRISYERTPAGLHVEVSSPSRGFELDFVRVE